MQTGDSVMDGQAAAMAAEGDEPARTARLQLKPGILPLLLVGGLLLGVITLGSALMPFILAILLAFFLNPLFRGLTRLGVPRTGAAALSAALGWAVSLAMIVLLALTIVDQAARIPEILPQLWGRLLDYGQELLPPRSLSGMPRSGPAWLRDPAMAFQEHASTAFPVMVSLSGSVFSLVLLVFLTPFVTFYLIKDGGRIVERLLASMSEQNVAELHAFGGKAKRRLFAVMGAQALISALQTAIYAAGFLIIGLNQALLLAAIAGFARLVPLFGAVVAIALALIAGLLQFDGWQPLAGILGLYVLAEILESAVLQPVIIGRSTNVHPLLVIATVLIGGAIFGIVGVFLALPLAAIIGILMDGAA